LGLNIEVVAGTKEIDRGGERLKLAIERVRFEKGRSKAELNDTMDALDCL
jgi:hypothetical protein